MTMEEKEMVKLLTDASYNKREDVLGIMRLAIRPPNQRLPFINSSAVFKALAVALSDDTWDIRCQCVKLINELIPLLGRDDCDSCMRFVIKPLVMRLGDSKITVCNTAMQALNTYAGHTADFQLLLQNIIWHGLKSKDMTLRRAVVANVSFLITKDHKHRNLYALVEALIECLEDDEMVDVHADVLRNIEKLKQVIGVDKMSAYIDQLPDSLRIHYQSLTADEDSTEISSAKATVETGFQQMRCTIPPSTVKQVFPARLGNVTGPTDSLHQLNSSHLTVNDGPLTYGIIPSSVMMRLQDDSSTRARTEAVEELCKIVNAMPDLAAVQPHVTAFINFLNKLLDDGASFQVVIKTLEILTVLIVRLDVYVKNYLNMIVCAITKQMVNPNRMVRQSILSIALRLMQILPQASVLHHFCENLTHRQSRVRAESLNVIIASLLTHPRNAFDLGTLCSTISHTLIDPKRNVRHAALECFAVIAQAMGPGKQQALVSAVDQLEMNASGEGVMAAVQARLARRQLPVMREDGVVEYAVLYPPNGRSSSVSGTSASHGADFDWIHSDPGVSSSYSSSNEFLGDMDTLSSRKYSPPLSTRRLGSAQSKESVWNGRESRERKTGRQHNSAPLRLVDDSTNELVKVPGNGSVLGADQQSSKNKNVFFVDVNDGGQLVTTQNRRGMLSQSWPQSQCLYDESIDYVNGDSEGTESPDSPLRQDYLDPITGRMTNVIPTRPAIVRQKTTSLRKKNQSRSQIKNSESFPPTQLPEFNNRNFDADETVLDSYKKEAADFDPEDTVEEMNNSLRQIRNSATKKQLSKLFDKLERNQSDTSPQGNASPEKDVTRQSPIESKPRVILRGHAGGVSGESGSGGATVNITARSDSELNSPFGSDVAVIGKGYSDDSHIIANRRRLSNIALPARRRLSKAGFALSPIESSTLHTSRSSNIFDDDKLPAGIVGRAAPQSQHGLVGTGYSEDDRPIHGAKGYPLSSEYNTGTGSIRGGVGVGAAIGGRQWIDKSHAPSGVYGQRVQPPSPQQPAPNFDDVVIETKASRAERENGVDLSEKPNPLQRINSNEQRRRQLDQDVVDYINTDNNINGFQPEDGTTFNDGTYNDSSLSAPVKSTPRKKKSKRSPQVSAALDISETRGRARTDSTDNPEEWKPFRDPNAQLKESLAQLANDNWENNCAGLQNIRRLSFFHPEICCAQLHPLTTAVLIQVKNLRSQVSTCAMACLCDLYENLKKNMDTEVDATTSVLLTKSGETNKFIKDGAEQALRKMTANVTSIKAIAALVTFGASHKNVSIRSTTAELLCSLVEQLGGPSIFDGGNRDILERILPITAQFMLDSSADVRYTGQKIMYSLMNHTEFDRYIKKKFDATTMKNIQEKLDNLRLKGLGDPPVGSSRTRRVLSVESGINGGSLRYPNTSNGDDVSNGSVPNLSNNRRRQPLPLSAGSSIVNNQSLGLSDLPTIESNLISTDWRMKYKGIEQLREVVLQDPNTVAYSNTILVRFIPLLHGANSKVNLFALRTLDEILPALASSFTSILNLTIETVASNLASKNRDISETASAILDSFMNHVDPTLLVQPFVSEAIKCKLNGKCDISYRVAKLIDQFPPQRSNQLLTNILPLVWHLLSATVAGSGSGPLHSATQRLVNSLHVLVGNELVLAMRNNPNVTQPMRDLMMDIIGTGMPSAQPYR